jgi:hypothetical protein
VIEGYPYLQHCRKTNIAGQEVSSHLLELLQRRGYDLSPTSDLQHVSDAKRLLCYVSCDYKQDVKVSFACCTTRCWESHRFCLATACKPACLGSAVRMLLWCYLQLCFAQALCLQSFVLAAACGWLGAVCSCCVLPCCCPRLLCVAVIWKPVVTLVCRSCPQFLAG